MNQRIELTVNGAAHQLEIPANRLLVDCLRYDLGLTGTKEGCSVGVTVIDLQRSRTRPALRERWYVKDVAQLLYSAPRPPVTRTDAVRFLRGYFGVAKLGRNEHAFARRVLLKEAAMRRRSG